MCMPWSWILQAWKPKFGSTHLFRCVGGLRMPWLTQKIEVAASGCLQHGWFPDEVHTDAMVFHHLGPACMIQKELLPTERCFVYLVVDRYSSKFGYLLLTQECFCSSAHPTQDNRLQQDAVWFHAPYVV